MTTGQTAVAAQGPGSRTILTWDGNQGVPFQWTSLSNAERAALDYVSELVQHRTVSPGTFAELSRHYTEREICDIVWLVASEHVYNMTNIGLGIGSDGMCDRREARSDSTVTAAPS